MNIAITIKCINFRFEIKFLVAAELNIKQIEKRTLYLRISGIWESNTSIGLTYKFINQPLNNLI